MNDYFNGNLHGRGFDAMYYWSNFSRFWRYCCNIADRWVVALPATGGVKKVLQKLGTDHKLSNATGHRSNIELIVSRVVFWVILIIAVIGALNVAELTSGLVHVFSNMIQQFLLFILFYLLLLLLLLLVGFWQIWSKWGCKKTVGTYPVG